MKNLTWQNPEQLFVAQELINKVKSKCCGIKVQQISFGMWFKYHNKNLSINDKLKSFIVCVMGPKWVVGFQDLFTRNE